MRKLEKNIEYETWRTDKGFICVLDKREYIDTVNKFMSDNCTGFFYFHDTKFDRDFVNLIMN